MEFSFSEEQEAIRELARRIFDEGVSPKLLAALEAGGRGHDAALWSRLAESNLSALLVPTELGGAGCGMLEVCLVLEEAGRQLAPVPLLPTLLLGAAPLARFGTRAQQERWLAPVVDAAGVLTAALHEEGGGDPARPRVRARREGSRWWLAGTKIGVPAASLAGAILVPAATGDGGVGVFLVEPDAAGVSLERQVATNREPRSRLELADAPVADDAVLAEPGKGAEVVAFIWQRARVGLCALQLGVASEALRRAAEYTGERRQFGRPVGSFQGVQLRAADGYIDLEAMRATLWQAAWRLDAGLPAAQEVGAACWWACRGGHRVSHTAMHLHGGIGADVSHPIHRYLLWARQIEVTLGGASRQLAELGRGLVAGAGEED